MSAYHVDLVVDFLLLVTQLAHDVVAGILGFVGDAIHHPKSVGLILGLPVEVQHAIAVAHGKNYNNIREWMKLQE